MLLFVTFWYSLFVVISAHALSTTPTASSSTTQIEGTSNPPPTSSSSRPQVTSSSTSSHPHTSTTPPPPPKVTSSPPPAPTPAPTPSPSTSSSTLPQPLPSSLPSVPLPLGPGGKNPKRGIAFASGGTPDDILNANQTNSAVTWIYDWANLPPAYIEQSNLKYIPMQWGSGNIDKLASVVSTQKADTLLGFNEPDFSNEANIRPVDAAALWMQFVQPLKSQGMRLGGPAVTAAPTGKQWLSEFMAACQNCSIDFLPLHWYGSGFDGFFNYIWDIHTSFPQFPIWVTEYADVSENDTVVWDFMNQTIHYLDSLAWIEKYAWFGFFRPEQDVHYNMLREDGGFNALGELYFEVKTVHTSNRTTGGVQYKTVSPNDGPNQPLVTSWPTFNAALPALSGSQGHIFLTSIILAAFLSLI